jgi:hypothetical protein
VHDTVEKRWRHMIFFQYRCEVEVVARMLGESDTRLWRIVKGRVDEAVGKRSMKGMRRIVAWH